MATESGGSRTVAAIVTGVALVIGAWIVGTAMDRQTEQVAAVASALGDLDDAIRTGGGAGAGARAAGPALPDPSKRYTVDVGDAPIRGDKDAKLTIVEFSDFQCPYCQRAMGTLEQVLAKYPADVRVVYRHLPLDRIHPNARPAAEASACADEQGRFWEYHDKLFQNNRALAREDLVRYAGEVGLDAARFQACVDERRFKDKVEADLQAAREVGITGTPAFVVNGTLLSGAQPPEEFYEVIDAVLGKAPEGGAAAPADAGGAS
jgi:protein-disulfide isomerase